VVVRANPVCFVNTGIEINMPDINDPPPAWGGERRAD
jgi:hypothetical protein